MAREADADADAEAPDTRTRLLREAAGLFSEQGYAAVPVRAICERAEANVAAINYHFGSKRALYTEVLLDAFARLRPIIDPPPWPPRDGPPDRQALAEAVDLWVRQMVRGLIRSESSAPLIRMLMRELQSQSEVLDRLIEDVFRPHNERATALLSAALPPGADALDAQLWAVTLMSQCSHYQVWRVPVLQLLGVESYSEELEGRIAAHISRFVLRGLDLPAPRPRGEGRP